MLWFHLFYVLESFFFFCFLNLKYVFVFLLKLEFLSDCAFSWSSPTCTFLVYVKL